jgi:hypothetical protein
VEIQAVIHSIVHLISVQVLLLVAVVTNIVTIPILLNDVLNQRAVIVQICDSIIVIIRIAGIT